MFFSEMDAGKAHLLNPLVLAYIGDAVLSLYIREKLVAVSDMKSGGLHKTAVKYVNAYGQAAQFDKIADMLTEAEYAVAKRARNCHNNTKAKNADIETYKKATSFEAVIGYLHISGQNDRMKEIIEIAYTSVK